MKIKKNKKLKFCHKTTRRSDRIHVRSTWNIFNVLILFYSKNCCPFIVHRNSLEHFCLDRNEMKLKLDEIETAFSQWNFNWRQNKHTDRQPFRSTNWRKLKTVVRNRRTASSFRLNTTRCVRQRECERESVRALERRAHRTMVHLRPTQRTNRRTAQTNNWKMHGNGKTGFVQSFDGIRLCRRMRCVRSDSLTLCSFALSTLCVNDRRIVSLLESTMTHGRRMCCRNAQIRHGRRSAAATGL